MMECDNRTLFIYSHDPGLLGGASLREHHVYLLCTGGRATFWLGGEQHRLAPHSAAMLSRPDKVVRFKASADFTVDYVAIASWWLHTLLPHDHYGVSCGIAMYSKPVMKLSELQARRMREDLANIGRRQGEWQQPFYREQVGSLCQLMIYDFYGCHALGNKRRRIGERQAVVLRRLMEMLEGGSAMTQRGPAWYAAQLGIDPKTLGDIVRSGTGYTLTALIGRYAVAHICELLAQDISAAQIARQMQFSSLPHLSLYASKRLGMTISEYRRKLMNDEATG